MIKLSCITAGFNFGKHERKLKTALVYSTYCTHTDERSLGLPLRRGRSSRRAQS